MDGNTIINELKQFITATVTQQIIELDKKLSTRIDTLEDKMSGMSGKIDGVEKRLEKKLGDRIDNLSTYIAQALDVSNETTDTQLARHEKRIARLERHANII
jgi:chaperonin cofactor prefoldin